MSNFDTDFAFQEKHKSQVEAILRRVVGKIADINIKVASDNEDKAQSTDYIVEVSIVGTVAVRIRRNTNFRDLTIRSLRTNGTKTELAKIKEGFARWYLYIWHDTNSKVLEWIIVDLDMVRSAELLDIPRKTTMNKDGTTGFINITIAELKNANALVHHAKA
jgi:hypothetical protein